MSRHGTRHMDRHSIEAMVDELERHAPRMLASCKDESGFWLWFSGEAASIGSIARSRKDWLYARDRLNRILQKMHLDQPVN